ncbi:hypothetical protein [Amycolatopsis rubida]|uniref:Uncharacterized protein n=1 Tax=Amycolatopsis rubida TaxID=112413 RepID=A0A1I5QN12_9PSEU|nr:hypothetical protein [Amycolatopsis rubida]SFP47612.1 hypothetical protein SAMN05421854_105383 [Amycolatopsis rubida]
MEPTSRDVLAAQRRHPDLLLWQGMEWNVPGAEHATLFFQAGRDQASVLREFERGFDWRLTGSESSSTKRWRSGVCGGSPSRNANAGSTLRSC